MKLGMMDVLDGLYRRRRVATSAMYALVAAFSYAAAYVLRFEFDVPATYVRLCLLTLPLLLVIRIACNAAFHLASERWRYVGPGDVVRLFTATAVGSLLFLAAVRALPLGGRVPNSVILMEAVLSAYITSGVWLAYRLVFERVRRNQTAGPARKRTLVVGAGEAGSLLVREMTRSVTAYEPVGFVDDNPSMTGARVHGLRVFGSTAQLAGIAREQRADKVIIAVPSASPADLRRIVACCEATGLPYKVLPGIAEVIAGRVSLQQLREVRIEDLLGREPVHLELPELAADLEGRTVLITGAAGSIGSELARQVALHRPAKLVLLDQAETDLFYLQLELRERHPELKLVLTVGDICDEPTVARTFRDHGPDRVFHAAAYKHVPMMELNPGEAIRNNVIGTWRVADAAGRYGSEKFVLVSTDKAVRPANMMGASKRLAELVVLELQQAYPDTSYGAVRFGNVLGSQGSVLPIFKRQLATGRPLTVTHPDATRYFMTIPEAAQLILQASLLPELQGHIAMLDMGEPVRIAELAANLLRLAGSPTRGHLVFTGLRPGEKLHEELAAPDEEAIATHIPKVQILRTDAGRIGRITAAVAEWQRAYEEGREDAVIEAVCELFPQYASHPGAVASGALLTSSVH